MAERTTSAGTPPRTAGGLLTAPVDAEDHVDGPDGARVSLVLYGDYECPFSRGAHDVVRHLQGRGETAFRYVFRHFPLPKLHAHAVNAARAAEAAASVGRFWSMHDALFARQNALGDEALLAYAAAAAVSAAAVRTALENGIHDARIARDVVSGVASGVRGVPALFVDGRRYRGPHHSRELGAALRAAALATG